MHLRISFSLEGQATWGYFPHQDTITTVNNELITYTSNNFGGGKVYRSHQSLQRKFTI